MTLEVCVVEGDGIGHEVVPAAVRVLQAVVPNVKIIEAVAGWETFQQQGVSLPDATIEAARNAGSVIFGACSSPSHPVEGYYSPIVRLRRELQAYANLRPARYLPVPTSRPGVDLVVVRENTEDLYVGNETMDEVAGRSTAEKVITRQATERVARLAYDLAINSGRKKVTVVTKANVLPQSDGLFRRVALEIAANFPEVETDELLVDTAAYWMVKEPTRFDIILTPNLYGDILSDMAAAWGGGLGLAPSVNIGNNVGIAEPVHGSAPDIAGKGIANPTASILSVAMMMRHHWNMHREAKVVEDAVRAALTDGMHTTDIYAEGAVSTVEYTDRIVSRLRM
ncbi:MAG: isocitrate/isopropylmalate dehydrogenase family protein [Chloroflexota bacterium]